MTKRTLLPIGNNWRRKPSEAKKLQRFVAQQDRTARLGREFFSGLKNGGQA